MLESLAALCRTLWSLYLGFSDNFTQPHRFLYTVNVDVFSISFLLLLSQMTANLVASKNIHLFSCSSGSQKSEMSFTGLKSRCLQGRASSRGSRGASLSLPFPVFRTACLEFFSLWPASSVCRGILLLCHIAFFSMVTSSSVITTICDYI